MGRTIDELSEEPTERLEERAVEGVQFAIRQLKRLRLRLPGLLRTRGRRDAAKAIAVVSAVQTALAHLAPINLDSLTRKIRRKLSESKNQ